MTADEARRIQELLQHFNKRDDIANNLPLLRELVRELRKLDVIEDVPKAMRAEFIIAREQLDTFSSRGGGVSHIENGIENIRKFILNANSRMDRPAGGKSNANFETAFETYEVLKPIGDGGSGHVYLVKDSGGIEHALKVLDRSASTVKRRRFKNEIDFCRKQIHPNIVSVTDAGLVSLNGKNCPFYVMPAYPATFRQVIKGNLPIEQVLSLYAKVLDGVEAAHLLGVTHRDLKPENILYDPADSRVVIADFGVADFEEASMATLVQTQPGERLANFVYAAPEQRIPGREVDARADIYALGLILNECFTKHVPQGANYPRVASVVPEYAYLDDLIDAMIQQALERRLRGVGEVKKQLIGRRLAFVTLQELNAKKNEVVPIALPRPFAPVELIAPQWANGVLYVELNCIPEPGWFDAFRNPGNFAFVLGAKPDAFSLNGKTLSVRVSEHSAQAVLDHTKDYVRMANERYREVVAQAASRAEQELREKFRREVEAAERNAAVTTRLKL